MAVNDQVARIRQAVATIISALNGKGFSVPDTSKVDEIEPYITASKNCYVGTAEPSASIGTDGDIYIKKG